MTNGLPVAADPDPWAPARRRMVEEQLRARGIHDRRVLEAMGATPRHAFVDPGYLTRAYGDHALPSEQGQTISQPYIVARMLELAELEATHRVLEIGTGTGYQSALLARLVERVYSVERVPSLLRAADQRLQALGVRNVVLRHGDGTLGWQEFAPYDRVLVAAAAPRVPGSLRAQLGESGILVIPVGGEERQHLEVWRRQPFGRWEGRRHGECRFVPLLGRDAWPDAPPKTE
jgi:protein-L-isoaspartate(D-aspartate) O-methyltransferase